MSDNADRLLAAFELDLAPAIRECLALYGYQPLMLVAVSSDDPPWIGLHADVGNRPPYKALVERQVGELVKELGMMAFLDGLE